MNKNQGFSLKFTIMIVVIASFISSITIGVILNNNFKNMGGISNLDILNDDALRDFLKVYSTINNEYYGDIDKNGMIDGAIEGMLNFLDDNYTNYLDKSETDALSESLNGRYKGIGIVIRDRTIEKVILGSPADKAGIKAGDIIQKIDNVDVSEVETKLIGELIKNNTNEFVIIEVLRQKEVLEFTLTVTELDVPVVYHEMIADTNIGYISIELFSKTVSDQFKKALKDLESQEMKSLIIDLRGNTGGYLNGAVDISSMFLKKGKKIFSLETSSGKTITKDKTEEHRNLNIVILLNKESASASEILAAALIDNLGAEVVGTTSFGKGKIQQTVTLKDGTIAKYTSGKWYRPNGKSIDQIGIEPDYNVEIEFVKDDEGNVIEIIDRQYEKAVEILSN